MIQIKRDETKVQLNFDSKLKIERNVFIFYWDAGKEYSAELLTQQLNKAMEDQLKKIRKEAYDKGFDDHKKRIARETWFSQWW